MAKLFLVRHGETSWNKAGLWQGQTDIPLSLEGQKQLDATDELLRHQKIDIIYTGTLSRLTQSEKFITADLHLTLPLFTDPALNERNYGIYTGRNKWDFEKKFGELDFEKVRRGWSTPIPEGETMLQVENRVVMFYNHTLLPILTEDKNILVVSSGNTLRALIKHLEHLSINEAEALELGFAETRIYEVTPPTPPHLLASSKIKL